MGLTINKETGEMIKAVEEKIIREKLRTLGVAQIVTKVEGSIIYIHGASNIRDMEVLADQLIRLGFCLRNYSLRRHPVYINFDSAPGHYTMEVI